MGYEFEGVVYGRLRDMQAARRARYAELLKAGMNFTQAAHAVGVSKRTGKVWRNGRTRSTGRNEGPLVDVLLQCLFSRLISIFPQCGRMVFPGLVIMQSVM